jgi:hypothetical protein
MGHLIILNWHLQHFHRDYFGTTLIPEFISLVICSVSLYAIPRLLSAMTAWVCGIILVASKIR